MMPASHADGPASRRNPLWRWRARMAMASGPVHGRPAARFATLAASLAGLMAMTNLGPWGSGKEPLLATDSSFLFMPPAVALVMLALSAAALLRARSFSGTAWRITESAAMFLTLLGGSFLGFQYLAHPGLPTDFWVTHGPTVRPGTRAGGTSPLDIGLFLLCGIALVCGRAKMTGTRRLRSLGGILALIALTASAGTGIAFLFGKQFPNQWTLLVPSVSAALAFALVSASILMGATPDSWPLRLFVCQRARGEREEEEVVEWRLVLLFLSTLMAVLIAGALHLNHRAQELIDQAQDRLRAVADLKVERVLDWREDRMREARQMAATPYAARRVLDALAHTGSSTTRRMLQGFLQPLLSEGPYARVLILDKDLEIRLTFPNGELPRLSEPARRAAAEASRNRKVVVSEVYQGDREAVLQGLMVPLVVRREGDAERVPAAGLAPNQEDLTAAVMVLEVDIGAKLFPLIRSWPTPSSTAETLLVKRVGDEVLFLHPLRHQTNASLTLRHPISEEFLPAAVAVRDGTEVREGVDYRGVPVAALARQIPETPWILVAKMDLAEVLAPMDLEALREGEVVFALLLVLSFGASSLWRRRNERLLRLHLVAERERRRLAERFRHLMHWAHDIIGVADQDWRILEVNDRAVQCYGYTMQEFHRMKLGDLRAPEARTELESQPREMVSQDHAVYETVHARRDGSTFPVEITARRVEIDGKGHWLAILRDITERKAHEAQMGRIHRLYATLSRVNAAIVRCQTRDQLFTEVCRIAVEVGGFQTAWIAWSDSQPGGPLAVAAQHTAGPTPPSGGPSDCREACFALEQATRHQDTIPCHPATQHPGVACCRDRASLLGIQSCSAFPIRVRENPPVALVVGSVEAGSFRQAETNLLKEIASDLAFAIEKFDQESRRLEAEAALRHQAEDMRTRNVELERFHRASVGRELRMIELKREVDELRRALNRPPRYQSRDAQGTVEETLA